MLQSEPIPIFCGYFSLDPQAGFLYVRAKKSDVLSTANALGEIVNTGNLRETFFIKQVGSNYNVQIPPNGDFIVEDKYTFGVGGKNKSTEQIETIADAWVAADNIEVTVGKKIPLWLFGFLY